MTKEVDFIHLFMPIRGDLLAYILSMGIRHADAEDILQECATVILNKFGSFEPGTNFRAWAYRITRIEVWNYIRRQQKPPLSLANETLETLESLATNENEVPSIPLRALRMCCEKLNERAKILIRLRYQERLTVGDIAEQLSQPIQTVHKGFTRIRQQLRACVQAAAPALRAQ